MTGSGVLKQKYKINGFKKLLKLFKQLLEGLQCIHEQGYLHLDIKLENIGFIKKKENYIPEYLDFGLAQKKNKIKKFVGKASKGYYDPYVYDENFVNIENRFENEQSDMYSLGIVFKKLLLCYNTNDFDKDIHIEEHEGTNKYLLQSFWNTEVSDAMDTDNDDIKEKITNLLLKMTKKERPERYSTVKECKEELVKIINELDSQEKKEQSGSFRW